MEILFKMQIGCIDWFNLCIGISSKVQLYKRWTI